MITFKVEPDGDEFQAYCPELPGCNTHGRTYDEAMENLKEAIILYIETLAEDQVAHQHLELATA